MPARSSCPPPPAISCRPPPSAAELRLERALELGRVHVLPAQGQRDRALALRQARLDLRQRRLPVGGHEEAGVDLVVEQVRLELRARGTGWTAHAPPPDLARLGLEALAQLVQVGV